MSTLTFAAVFLISAMVLMKEVGKVKPLMGKLLIIDSTLCLRAV
jgi:hypothetical protein